MKNTSRDWIQASPTRSGITVMNPPTPVAAPSRLAIVACRRRAIWASLRGSVP